MADQSAEGHPVSDDVLILEQLERDLRHVTEPALNRGLEAARRLEAIDYPGAGAVREQLAGMLADGAPRVDGSLAAALLYLEEFRLTRAFFGKP